MNRHPNLLWITCIALGWIFDLLFWKQPLGVNFALYVVLCLAGGFIVLAMNGQYPDRRTLWLIPPLLFFVLITVVRTEPLTLFLGVVFTLLLLLVLANTFLGGRWLWYGLGDYINALLRVAGSMIARPLGFASQIRREQAEAAIPRTRLNLWPFVRGIVIALPIVAIFAALLASADAVFNSQLDAFLRYFEIQNLPQYIFRLAYVLVGAYLLVGVILHASIQSKDEKLLGEDRPLMATFLGFTEAITVLSGVGILFVAFVIIQFRYFFGGQANIAVAGFTYAEYARRGFGELVTVAFFSLLLILGLGTVTRRDNMLRRWLFSGLSVTIVALVMVMLVSAYQRLVLYERAYGFSRLRTYTHVSLAWIGALLVAVVVLEVFRQERRFALAALMASIGFVASLAILNVDSLIVRQNVRLAGQGAAFDVPYVDSLSVDSVPALVDAFQSPSTSSLARDAVGAALFCRLHAAALSPKTDWRAFTLAGRQADAALKRIADRLIGYHLLDNNWPKRISSPLGAAYNCYGGGLD